MEVVLTKIASIDYLFWKKNNPVVCKKINKLIEAIKQDPYRGIGKPEPLKHDFSGWWAREITQEHRIVYRVSEHTLQILQLRYHYTKK